jgi:hypothetical protein
MLPRQPMLARSPLPDGPNLRIGEQSAEFLCALSDLTPRPLRFKICLTLNAAKQILKRRCREFPQRSQRPVPIWTI